MNRTATKTTGRVSLCLLAVGSWVAMAAPEAHAAQSPDAAPTVFAAPQETQSPEAEDSGIDWTRGWSYGARGVLSILGEASLDPGLGFTGFSVLRLSTDLELEGEIGYLTMSTEAGGLPAGRLSMFPLRATLRVQLWRFGGAKPYAGGGAGIYLNRFTLDESVAQDLATLGLAAAANVDPAFGFHGAGGVEWQRGGASFGVDVKYVFGNTNVISTVVDQLSGQVFRETSSLKLGGFWVAAGLRFHF